MKTSLLLILCSFVQLSIAMELEVKAMEKYSFFDEVFMLSNPDINKEHAILDCQSFFQKLDFKKKKDVLYSENYITTGECKYIYNTIKSCLKSHKVKCLDSNDIFNTSCKCN